MLHRSQKFFCSLVLATISIWTNAEVITIGQQSPHIDRSELPQRGMSMSTVTSRFGKPLEKSDAVGSPPITQWTYDDYTVYFEHQHVLQTVVQAAAESDATPNENPSTEDHNPPTEDQNPPAEDTKQTSKEENPSEKAQKPPTKDESDTTMDDEFTIN